MENQILIKFNMESTVFDETIFPKSIVWDKNFTLGESRGWLCYTYGVTRHDKIHLLLGEIGQKSPKDSSN